MQKAFFSMLLIAATARSNLPDYFTATTWLIRFSTSVASISTDGAFLAGNVGHIGRRT